MVWLAVLIISHDVAAALCSHLLCVCVCSGERPGVVGPSNANNRCNRIGVWNKAFRNGLDANIHGPVPPPVLVRGDDAGHVVALELGGGNDAINIFPQV